MKKFINVYQNGTYYSPANKHYGYKGTVSCNKCYKTNLDICVGLNDVDLCIECVNSVEHFVQNTNIPNKVYDRLTKMVQTQFEFNPEPYEDINFYH